MIEDCTAIVMAGGDSRRMGQDKADLVFDGETLLRRAIATMQAIFPKVIVSVRQVRAGLDVPQVCDELPASVAAGRIDLRSGAGRDVVGLCGGMRYAVQTAPAVSQLAIYRPGIRRWSAGGRVSAAAGSVLCDERSGCDACGFCARRQKPA